jgi:hypothetical protein
VVTFFAASCDYTDYGIDATTIEALALLAAFNWLIGLVLSV